MASRNLGGGFYDFLFQRIVTSLVPGVPSSISNISTNNNYFNIYLFLFGDVVFETHSHHVNRHCTVLRVFNFCPLKFSAYLSNRKFTNGYKFFSENA